MTEPTAPGWYEDPQDSEQLRYFDGIVWTAHTTPLRSPTAAASTIGRAPAVEARPRPDEATARQQAPGASWSAPPAYPAPATAATLPDGAVLAEWWRRLLARIVDSVVTSIVAGVASLPFIGPMVDAFEELFSASLAGQTPDQSAFEAAVGDAVVPVTAISLVVGLVYEIGFLVWRSATPGKMLLGTVVRPVESAGRVSFAVAARRQAITVVSSLLGLNAILGLFAMVLSVLDPAWLLWDARRQCLHDKVAATVVVLRR